MTDGPIKAGMKSNDNTGRGIEPKTMTVIVAPSLDRYIMSSSCRVGQVAPVATAVES